MRSIKGRKSKRMLDSFLAWQSFIGPGCWADGDMLPLGRIGIRQHPDNAPDRMSRLTHYEQTTMAPGCSA